MNPPTPLTIEQTFTVSYRYPVHFTRGVFEPGNLLLAETLRPHGVGVPARVVFVLDEGVVSRDLGLPVRTSAYAAAHAGVMQVVGGPLVIPGGEATKNKYAHVEAIQDAVCRFALCRQSYIVAVGGGALLDLAGFAASTAHRGVRLVRVPTTVLSQNDSGVGVKNSVNAFGRKNFLGTFAPPFAVLNDSDFLRSLDDRDWRAGIAEAVKVALIKDAAFFADLERDAAALVARDMPPMERLVYRCAALHLDHIARGGDPFETGSSRPLDFGHWAAHKLEQLTNYRLRHGEAVAIGIALDVTYAHLTGMLPAGAWERILRLLGRLEFALHVPELDAHIDRPDDPRCVLSGLAEFREHLGGRLTVMMLRDIGRGEEVHEIDAGLMIGAAGVLRRVSAAYAGGADSGNGGGGAVEKLASVG